MFHYSGPYPGGVRRGSTEPPILNWKFYSYCKTIFSTIICVLAFITRLPWLLPAEPRVASSGINHGASRLSVYICVETALMMQWRIQDGAFGANPPPPPPFKKLHTRSRYSNRAVNYSNKAVTMFMRQCSLPMKL